MLMHFLSRFFTALLFKISLSLLVISSTALYVTSHPALLKSSLAEARVYEDIVPAVLQTVAKDTETMDHNQNSQNTNDPFRNPEIRAVVRESVDPEILKTQTNAGIDAVSNWITQPGNNKRLQFTMDFQPVKEKLIADLSDYAFNKTSSLQPCTAPTSGTNDQDLLVFQCRPPGIDRASVEQSLREQLEDVDLTVTEKTLQKDGQAPLEERLTPVKKSYGLLKTVAVVSLVASVLAALLYIVAHRPLSTALYGLGKSVLSSGLLILIPAFVVFIIASKRFVPGSLDQEPLARLAAVFTNVFIRKIASILMIWGSALSVFGLILVILERKQVAANTKQMKERRS